MLKLIHYSLWLSLLMIHSVIASPLADYEWQKRPLLLFASDDSNQHLQQTLRALDDKKCDVENRAIIIGVILQKGLSQLSNKTISNQEVTNLRERYAIKDQRFVIVLIGKDGGEKYRNIKPPQLKDIFNLIDGMPMRQDEMKQRPVDCQ